MELLPEIKEHRQADHPIPNQFLNRWSPRAFSNAPVSDEILKNIFEAARWAASSFNEQPWRFIVAKTVADRGKIIRTLVAANQAWAKEAPVLMVSVGKKTFTHNGKPNRVYMHDVGAASAYMALAATHYGLHAHGMAGFDPDLAKSLLGIPDDYEPIAVWAIGYRGDASQLPEKYQEMEVPSGRRPLTEILMEGEFHEVQQNFTQGW